MPKKATPKKNQVLQAVHGLSGKVQSLSGTVKSLSGTVKELSVSMDSRFTEVHEAIMTLATMTEGRFDRLEGRVVKLETGMVTKEYLKDYIDHRLGQFETRMVTKDYLDQKIGSLRGDLVVLTRRPDQKVDTLVGILHEKRVMTDADVRRVNSATH